MKLITNFIVDAVVFGGFLIVNANKMTTQTIHEWLGLAVFVTLLFHLFLHWRWVVNKVSLFFKKMPVIDRINFLVDFVFFIAIIAVTLTGVLMSKAVLPSFGISVSHGGTWKQLHSLAANASLYALAVHFALHWTWVVSAFKHLVIQPVAGLLHRTPRLETTPLLIENDQARLK
jgi:cytochrome b561